ncbi:S1C family serine protease [Variovorax robiniae]|uniref:S1C family serine protease n=1 Tax=Variovorax robiniae TaxID=1836199 RepID=A0ABU8XAS0_9BURK
MMDVSNSSSALPDAVARLAPSVVGVATRRRSGSGVLWRAGVVVTSASAVWRASSVSLALPDGEHVPGEVRGTDGSTDLAVVTFESRSMPVAERAAAGTSRIGDFVFALGRDASGLAQASFGHVGSVAGEWRTWRGGRVDQLIRLDGGLYPGLTGAPVADGAGKVIGIASDALSRHHGVVLPVATIDRVLDQLLSHGRMRHGYLGIAAQPVRATFDGSAVDGLLVSSLADDGPAARAGILVSDVIVKVDGEAVTSLAALRDRMTVGAQVRVLLSRGGAAHEITVEVGERPASRCG